MQALVTVEEQQQQQLTASEGGLTRISYVLRNGGEMQWGVHAPRCTV